MKSSLLAQTLATFSASLLTVISSQLSGAGEVYWTDRGTHLVQKANLDGSDVMTLVTLPGNANIRGLSLNLPEGTLYFADNGSNSVYRSRLDGTELETLVTGLGFPADMELDRVNQHIYWCDQQMHRIQRAHLDGSDVETVLETNSPYFMELDLPSNRLYWGHFSEGTIHRASLDGSNLETLVAGLPRVRAVKLNAERTHLYWCDREAHKFQRRLLEGGPIEDIYTGLDTPHGMVLDHLAQKAYWADTGTNRVPGSTGGQAVCRGDMDGRHPIEVLVNLSQPWDVDIDPSVSNYNEWVTRFFHRDATETGPEVDSDGDGSMNLLEYALGSHPDRTNSLPDYRATWEKKDTEDKWMAQFHYERFQGAGDLHYLVEVSQDGQNWFHEGDGSGTRWTGPPEVESWMDGLERIRVPILRPVRLLRVRVQLQ